MSINKVKFGNYIKQDDGQDDCFGSFISIDGERYENVKSAVITCGNNDGSKVTIVFKDGIVTVEGEMFS